MYPHGVDPVQFTAPVLSLVFRNIWKDGSKVRKTKKSTVYIFGDACGRELGGRGAEEEEVDTQTLILYACVCLIDDEGVSFWGLRNRMNLVSRQRQREGSSLGRSFG